MNSAGRWLALFVALTLSNTTPAGEIFEHTDPGTGTQVYVLKQGGTVVRFAPAKGANVFSIQVAGIEYLRAPADMYTFDGLLFGVPVLYPTPNRVRNATFTFAGETYEFEPNFGPHHIHGLVIGQPWQVLGTETTDRAARIRSAIGFAPGSERYAQFPFAHRLVLTVSSRSGSACIPTSRTRVRGKTPGSRCPRRT